MTESQVKKDLTTIILDLKIENDKLQIDRTEKIKNESIIEEKKEIEEEFKKICEEFDNIKKEYDKIRKKYEKTQKTNYSQMIEKREDEYNKMEMDLNELKKENNELKKYLNFVLLKNNLPGILRYLINEFTELEQKEIIEFSEEQREEKIILKIISKIPEKGLRDAVNKFSKKEQKETVLLPKEEREKELEKIKNELSMKDLKTIKSYDILCSLSKHALRNIVNSIDLSMNNITKENVIEMSNSILPYCHKLSSICLSGNPRIGDEGVTTIITVLSSKQYPFLSKNLIYLGLSDVNVTDKGAMTICDSFQILVSLEDLYLRNTFESKGVTYKNDITDQCKNNILNKAPPKLKIKFY